ncbi:MAG: 50S ribosomal protein L16 [Candidatus Marsarchaeota archaeon]|nr:50S ribosomal protein L16 [Candidatus Marsarchaeota archaeon]
MARMRPARTSRDPFMTPAWARYSLRRPRKNYVRALPHRSILVFNMGVQSDSYEMTATLHTDTPIQLRSNALESARQMANKYLEANIPNAYSFKVLVYPHNVIREHKMATGAGADRISQGMSHAFGKPVAVAARLVKNQPLMVIKTSGSNRKVVREAFKRAAAKLSGSYSVKFSM